jgi:ketosteroid isomerase-like protein
MDYTEYVAAFNSGDDAALVKRFFTADVMFQSGTRVLRGADELLQFLNWAHDGIREIIRAQLVLRDENHIFAEIDMDFHATRDKPDFVFGALKQGEFTTVKFLVVYYLRDGKVAQLKASTWPPNVGVSKPVVRLGGSLEQRQAFFDYARAFSNGEFEKFSQYYTDDVRCELGATGIVLEGRDGIVNFYRAMFKTVRESLTLHQLVADDNGLVADVTSQFTAIEDAPEFVVTPLKKGQFVRVRVFVYYTLRDGKIAHIRVARAGALSEPQM